MFGRASFIEIFETAPSKVHSLYSACYGSEQYWFSALSGRRLGVRVCILLFTKSISFSSRFSPRISSSIPWMQRFGRLDYCCIESSSSARVSTLFSRCTISTFLSDNCTVRLANSCNVSSFFEKILREQDCFKFFCNSVIFQ